ncbi:efflux transporter, RND family, MFP subunit [Melioribacter roseus P3M-2]|uniref:Efflux transporter, RND family, MFP subunit n=1 Tax=Melioribacter roseus (strain DSM 23840 / JCM 17771 / VKM B-2668 / P3M-2) TaxID=1191523 RepID=I7A6K7_MELRP|nr:efflux RND transporter periplasmic adaptor subunit [Melioribacter roseus]AFN75511.1 efflux transporter, RND family, MFP subunit [Melioribacter roseus P3M-2]
MANGKKKSRKKLFVFGGLGLLLVVVILLVAFAGNKEEIIPVQTEKVSRRTITQVVTATGKINPEFQVKIAAEATGEIVSLLVQEGDHVKKGQLLLRIKPDIYEAQKNSAEARLQQARASLSSTKALLEKVESDYKRVQELTQKGLASDADLEAARSNYLQTLGNYESQKSLVSQAEAALKEAIETLNKTYVYSPMDGTISKLNVELGERVIGSGFTGTELLTVADLNNMEATVEVDENDVVLVSIGDTAKINIDAFGDKVFKGIVTQIGNSAITSGLGTQDEVVNFEVKIRLTDKDDKIRPGMSCDADIETETKENVLAVPIQSVTARVPKPEKSEEGDEDNVKENNRKNKPQEVVFIVENGKAKMVKVKTGISDDNYIEIIEGLQGGEEVISGPYRAISKELEDGKTVTVTSGKSKLAQNEK